MKYAGAPRVGRIYLINLGVRQERSDGASFDVHQEISRAHNLHNV